ncbi:vWA domain-containing protein [Actinosynnema sp. NPDC020468]|uniref:vWA domain-containing protein n=1 Tax=Actinosynnema sp. NPDC020468 TaxID=3154488 RepID=UPI0033CC89D3
MGIGVLLGPVHGGTAEGQGSSADDPPPALPALQVVVLVDESGSIQEADLVREKEAARTIVFSALAPGSQVSVVGFASTGEQGRSAVDVVCPPTVLDGAQARDTLAGCVGNLRKRTDQEGSGTDHVLALRQAREYVKAGGPEKKIVFLLTDGKLDVSDSPNWGEPSQRNQAAAAALPGVLGELEQAGAQVWPLGFGAVDQAALRGFAKGKSCTPAAADPHESVVPNAAELTQAVSEAFSSAGCIKFGAKDTGSVPKGGSTDLHVSVPAAASDASIVVYKRDPRVQVEYRAPGASKPAPEQGGSAFELAGQATETESLRITDPEPGEWTIRLSSADVAADDVAATVVYQAAVRANISGPPQPAAGQSVEVAMQIWARGKAVIDKDALAGLSFVTTLTGSSNFPPQRVTLTDPDGDGTFTGSFTVPADATGDLTFTGQVSGIGVGGDTRVFRAAVQREAPKVRARFLFDTNRATASPGDAVTGKVSVSNDSGSPARLLVQLAEPTPGTQLTVDDAEVEAGTGTSETPFTLRFGDGSSLGVHGAKLRLVEADDPSAVVAERLFSTEVVARPGVVERFLWLWIPVVVLLLGFLGWLLIRSQANSRSARVRGLRAQLWRGGFTTSDVVPRDPESKVFGFVLHEDFTGLQLHQAGPGEPGAYEVRRAGRGVALTAPGGRPVVLALGERHEIGPDLAVEVLDERGVVGGPPDPFSPGSVGPPPGEPFATTSPPTATAGPGDFHTDPHNPFD